jgi:hypothetical protein
VPCSLSPREREQERYSALETAPGLNACVHPSRKRHFRYCKTFLDSLKTFMSPMFILQGAQYLRITLEDKAYYSPKTAWHKNCSASIEEARKIAMLFLDAQEISRLRQVTRLHTMHRLCCPTLYGVI